MVDVNFEEEQVWQRPGEAGQASSGSKMADWLLKKGIVKDANQANYVLIGIFVVVVLITVAVLVFAM
jgi:hypothetical protein